MRQLRALVHAWLVLDFFGESRRSGQPGSSLTTAIFGQSFLGLLMAAVLLPDDNRPGHLVVYATANLSLSTLLVGIALLGEPGRLQRQRADAVVVGTAPLPPWMVAAARLLHGTFYLVLLVVGVALPPAILSYWVAGRAAWIVPAYLGTACWLAGLVAGALAVAVGAAARWLGPSRGETVGALLRTGLLAFGFIGFAIGLRHLRGTTADLPVGTVGALCWPPYWAGRALAGTRHWPWFVVALLACGLFLLLLAGAAQRPALTPGRASRTRTGPLARLDEHWAATGSGLGLARFTSIMLLRNPGFRGKVLPLFGLPAAMVMLAWAEADARQRTVLLGVVLQLPSIYVPLLVAFLPAAEEEGCRWVWDTAPLADPVVQARRAALVSLTSHVLVPTYLVLGVATTVAVGPAKGLALTAFSLGGAVWVAKLALKHLDMVPFTDESGQTRVDPGTLIGAGTVLGLAGGAFGLAPTSPWGSALAIALPASAAFLLRRTARHAA